MILAGYRGDEDAGRGAYAGSSRAKEPAARPAGEDAPAAHPLWGQKFDVVRLPDLGDGALLNLYSR
jgi:hypothetical protein